MPIIEPLSSKRRLHSNNPTTGQSRQRARAVAERAYYEPEARTIKPRPNIGGRDRESTASRNIIKDNMLKVIFDNSAAVKRAKMTRDEIKAKEPDMHKNYGKIPSYINRYHKERHEAQVQQMIEEEKARHPPGTRLMPEEERLETLNDLKESRREINIALEKLPVGFRTLNQEKHKKDLQEKLVRIERAIETFEKKHVYVAF